MVWYLWALLSTIFQGFESIIDKALVIEKEHSLDRLIASFYRNFAFWLFALIGAVSGLFGGMMVFFTLPLAIFALLHVGASLIYDHFLRSHEVSRFRSILYVFPFLLIFADNAIFSIEYGVIEFLGILFLLVGGFLVSYENRGLFSAMDWLFFLADFLIGAFGYILFKWYNSAYGLNEVSFFANTWLLVTVFFAVFIIFTGKQTILVKTAREDGFLLKTLVSKCADFLHGFFFLRAISLSTVAKTYAVTAFFPLVLLIMVWLAVHMFGMDLKERVHAGQKAMGIVALSAGLFLII